MASITIRKDEVFWDPDPPGFGVRVYPPELRSMWSSAAPSTVQTETVGRHGEVSVD